MPGGNLQHAFIGAVVDRQFHFDAGNGHVAHNAGAGHVERLVVFVLLFVVHVPAVAGGGEFEVVGVGGVGSWAAEALIRTAAADITLIDLDNVAESNVNRQIQAMDGNFGKAKIDVLRDRAALINPNCRLTLIEDFVNEENVAELVGSGAVVLDCIDQVRAKAALIAHCKRAGNFVVASGAAGGRVNPSLIKIGDLGQIKGDPLLSGVRYRLRNEYGFPKADSKGSQKPFKITAV